MNEETKSSVEDWFNIGKLLRKKYMVIVYDFLIGEEYQIYLGEDEHLKGFSESCEKDMLFIDDIFLLDLPFEGQLENSNEI